MQRARHLQPRRMHVRQRIRWPYVRSNGASPLPERLQWTWKMRRPDGACLPSYSSLPSILFSFSPFSPFSSLSRSRSVVNSRSTCRFLFLSLPPLSAFSFFLCPLSILSPALPSLYVALTQSHATVSLFLPSGNVRVRARRGRRCSLPRPRLRADGVPAALLLSRRVHRRALRLRQRLRGTGLQREALPRRLQRPWILQRRCVSFLTREQLHSTVTRLLLTFPPSFPLPAPLSSLTAKQVSASASRPSAVTTAQAIAAVEEVPRRCSGLARMPASASVPTRIPTTLTTTAP